VNVRNALAALFALGSVPVVNENDATATDEISFGDNDALAAQVAVLVNARLLVLLTSVPGVLREGVLVEDGASARSVDFGPGSAVGARTGIGEQDLRRGTRSRRRHPDRDRRRRRNRDPRRGTRGPRARNALRRCRAGVGVQALAAPRQAGRGPGSMSTPAPARPSSMRGASLLAVGVTAADGGFRAGDGVELVGPDGEIFARGIAAVDAADLDKRPANVEAVHRDRLVVGA